MDHRITNQLHNELNSHLNDKLVDKQVSSHHLMYSQPSSKTPARELRGKGEQVFIFK
jgi:hypothetical protein